MIHGIFFDAAGILYLRTEPTAKFAVSLLQQSGYNQELSSQDQERLEVLRLEANQGIAGYTAYWDHFLLLHGVTDPRQRVQITNRIIDYSNDVQPAPDGRKTLSKLKQRGYTLGIITDTMYPLEWKKRRLVKAKVAEFIDVIACSTDLGLHKPDPRIYQYAIQQMNFFPQQTAFIGHSAIELGGARTAGMTTIAVNYDPDAQADYYCPSLSDLLNLPIFKGNLDNQP